MTVRALLAFALLAFACSTQPPSTSARDPHIVVLGIAQDGGYPQAGCNAPHCDRGWKRERRHVTSLAIVDPLGGQRWVIDATPDFPLQLRRLDSTTRRASVTGIFLTHAHVGHYAGLMHLGREVMGAKGVRVYAMPRMKQFLETNGPWDQLVRLDNIALIELNEDAPVALNERMEIVPFRVPHRDEYSETVGYEIRGSGRRVLFIPDIDKWEKWDRRVEEVIARVDVAYLDGTFYAEGELPGRNMAEIPHPFIVESMQRFASLPLEQRRKIRFIHLNHTNPALFKGEASEEIRKRGFNVAREGERVSLQ